MKKSRIFIFPSYEEGWGIAVAEAIAAGLKVVLYDIGTYKIFEKNVIAVEKANIAKMAKIIIELIGNQNSNDTREGKLGRVSNVLDWQDVANREMQSISNWAID